MRAVCCAAGPEARAASPASCEYLAVVEDKGSVAQESSWEAKLKRAAEATASLKPPRRRSAARKRAPGLRMVQAGGWGAVLKQDRRRVSNVLRGQELEKAAAHPL